MQASPQQPSTRLRQPRRAVSVDAAAPALSVKRASGRRCVCGGVGSAPSREEAPARRRPSTKRASGRRCVRGGPFPGRGALRQPRPRPSVPMIPWEGGGERQRKGPPQVGGGGGGFGVFGVENPPPPRKLDPRNLKKPLPPTLPETRPPKPLQPLASLRPPAGAGGSGDEPGRASAAARPGGSGAGWGVLCVCVCGGDPAAAPSFVVGPGGGIGARRCSRGESTPRQK